MTSTHTAKAETSDEKRGFAEFRERLRKLYHGRSPASVRFQYAVVSVDLAIIAFFIATPVIQNSPSFILIDYSIAALLGIDTLARALASRSIGRWLTRPTVWVDLFILLTLWFPSVFANFAFLRILRLWSLSRSGFLWRTLGRWRLARWRDPAHAVINLLTFLFIITGFVYTFFFQSGTGFAGYIDALYFTVATITTTGFGDIVLPGVWGKLTSIATMIIGISLFVRVGQSVFRPPKVYFPCPQCALERHDVDAVHCGGARQSYSRKPDLPGRVLVWELGS